MKRTAVPVLGLVVAGLLIPSLSGAPRAHASVTAVPAYKHVFYVMFENRDYSAIIGSPNAPYLNSLARANGLATNYHAIQHPSLVNYLAAISGRTYRSINDNCTVTITSCSTNQANLTDRLEAKGKTWKGYLEGMPAACYRPHDAGLYTERHNPFPYFNQIRTHPARCAKVVPYTQLARDLTTAATTPGFSWITPNLCDDMHNACAPSNAVRNGDTWASHQLPRIIASRAWKTQPCLIVITGDENGGAAGNRVPAIFISSDRSVKAGTRSGTYYTHYSLLRTLEDSFGVTTVGPGDAAARPMLTMFS